MSIVSQELGIASYSLQAEAWEDGGFKRRTIISNFDV